MIQTPVSAAIEVAIFLRNFFDDVKGAHAIVVALRDTLARLRLVLEPFPPNNRIDEGLRAALGELGALVEECEAERTHAHGRTQSRTVFSAGQLIAMTKLDERVKEYVEKRLPPVVFEKSPETLHRIHTANAVNSSLNHSGANNTLHLPPASHNASHQNTLQLPPASHNAHQSRHPPTSQSTSQHPTNGLQVSAGKPRKLKYPTKAKVKRGNPYLEEMSCTSCQLRPRSEYSQKLIELRARSNLQNFDSKTFYDMCFSQEGTIEWQAFCDQLNPFVSKYWNISHECCSPILSLVKQSLDSGQIEIDNASTKNIENTNPSGGIQKAQFETLTQEKPVLRVYSDLLRAYMIGEWKRDTQENTTASLTLRLENLVKKFGDSEFCGEFFDDNSSRCADLLQVTARLLVRSLNNQGSSSTMNSLALAVQGLEILARNEYHVLLLLESGILPHAIDAAHKLKDATSNSSCFPASLRLLANLCKTELGAFMLLRENVHNWVASLPRSSQLYSAETALSIILFFTHFHKNVQKLNIIAESGAPSLITGAFSAFKENPVIVNACCIFMSTLKSDELSIFSGIISELCECVRKPSESEKSDLLLSHQLSLLAFLCANEKNAQQVIEANILPTLVGLMTNVKTKNNLGVILSLFGVIGNLVEFFNSAKAFEQSGGLSAVATYVRNTHQPEVYVGYCNILHCYLPSVLSTSVSTQFHTVVDTFANVKTNSEATLSMLRVLSLFAVNFNDMTASFDGTKVGTLALEAIRAHTQVQAQGCHVIGAWADRLRRALHAPDAAASLAALLPYTNAIVAALTAHSDNITVLAEGFSAIAFLLVLDIPASFEPDRVDILHLLKMCAAAVKSFPNSKAVFSGVARLLHRICKIAEFSHREILKMGCDDTFLETLLWAIENSPLSSACSRLLQSLRIIFHVKEMGTSSAWCSGSVASVVNGMRRFTSDPKLARTGSYILHKITTINASYGTNGMVEVALAALRNHSQVWDIPFRAGTLLLSLIISVANLRTFIAQQGGLPQLWSARKFFDISEANERGFEKALTLLQHSITSSSSPTVQPILATAPNGDPGDFYYNNVYTQEGYGANVKHTHIIDMIFQKSEDKLEAIAKVLQSLKVDGWCVKSHIPRTKVSLVKQIFKVPAWEQPLALLECFPNQGQSGMTLFAMTSGMWYQNSGFTSSPFSERMEGFLTWADIANGKLGISDLTVVTVGQASIEVGRTISSPLHNLFIELQRFLQVSQLWDGLSEVEPTKPSSLNVLTREWQGGSRGSWYDGTLDDDYGTEVKVCWANHTSVVPKDHTRPPPTNQQAHKIREGCTVEVHQAPIWIPAKVVQHNSETSNILSLLFHRFVLIHSRIKTLISTSWYGYSISTYFYHSCYI